MNLSDVKTQSSPECGLPKGRRFRVETAGRDHKSLTLATVSAVVYLIVSAYRRLLCNRDVKEKACRSWLPHSYSPSSVRKRCIKIETGERDRGWQGDGNGPLGFLILLYGERTRWRRDEEKEGRRTKRGKKRKRFGRDCVERRKLQTRKLSEVLLSPTRPPSGTVKVTRYTSISKYSASLILRLSESYFSCWSKAREKGRLSPVSYIRLSYSLELQFTLPYFLCYDLKRRFESYRSYGDS